MIATSITESQASFSKVVASFLLALFFFIASQIIIEEWNPDWFAYYKIFEDGGWIDDAGKDPGFSLIISFFKLAAGNNYELFRIIIALYLSFFIFRLSLGKIISYSQNSSIAIIIITILSFMIVRVTIQIRECIAVTFLIYGISLLYKNENSTGSFSIRNKVMLILIASFFVHSGLLLFLLVYFLAIFLTPLKKKSLKSAFLIESILVVMILFVAIGFAFLYEYIISDSTLFFGAMDLEKATTYSIGKMGYWAIYGVFVFLLRNKMMAYINSSELPNLTVTYFKLLSGMVMPIVYSLIIIFIFFQFSSLITGAFGRLLNLLIGINVLLLAFKTRNHFLVSIFSLFFIIDQMRIVIEALISYELI